MMYSLLLPSYSAERYFLLSEIEQRSSIILLDGCDNLPRSQSSADSIICRAIYALIQLDNEISIQIGELEEIIKQISKVAKSQFKDQASKPWALFIDLVIPSGKVWTDYEYQIKNKIDRLFKEVSDKLLFETQIKIALEVACLSDNVGAAPALEKYYDVLEALQPGYRHMTEDINEPLVELYVKNRVELMGLDPLRGPDAVSDVFQVMCLAKENAIEEFVTQLKSENSTIFKPPKKNKKSSAETIWIYLTVACIAVAMGFIIVYFR